MTRAITRFRAVAPACTLIERYRMRTVFLLVLLAACSTHKAHVVPGAVKTTPRELFADFTRPDADGLALLDKYRDGATFTGMLKTVGEDETGRPVLMMDVDGRNIISLGFLDPRQAMGLKQGESLTVTCKMGGASGALMMVTDCVL
jgi:hypothetical protein